MANRFTPTEILWILVPCHTLPVPHNSQHLALVHCTLAQTHAACAKQHSTPGTSEAQRWTRQPCGHALRTPTSASAPAMRHTGASHATHGACVHCLPARSHGCCCPCHGPPSGTPLPHTAFTGAGLWIAIRYDTIHAQRREKGWGWSRESRPHRSSAQCSARHSRRALPPPRSGTWL